MNTPFNIFSIAVSDFDEGQRDPFGFDDFSEKLGSKYLPFTGTVRKPIYFFFVKYIDWLLQQGELPKRRKEEVKLRLEKLLVYSWKRKGETLKKNVLGNRQKNINPFKGNDGNWIVQTCFDIYGTSVSKLIDSQFIEKYVLDNPGEEKTLQDFLSKTGILDRNNEALLENTLKKLSQRRYSLFNGEIELANKYKRLFKKYLEQAIWKTNPYFYNDVRSFFDPTLKLEDRLYKKTLGNEKKYPFKSLNNWFAAFVIAVDKDINDEPSTVSWQKADGLYLKIPEKYRHALLRRPEPKCWFDRSGTKYVAKSSKDFNEQGWNALVRRANGGDFYDFRHTAFVSLLNGIY